MMIKYKGIDAKDLPFPFNQRLARSIAERLNMSHFAIAVQSTNDSTTGDEIDPDVQELTNFIGAFIDPARDGLDYGTDSRFKVLRSAKKSEWAIAACEAWIDDLKTFHRKGPDQTRQIEHELAILKMLGKEADEPDQNNANWTRSEQIALMDMYGLIDMVYEKTKSKEDAYKIISIISGMPKDSAKHNVLSLNPQSGISRAKYNADKAKSEVEKKLKRLSIQ